MIEDEICTGMDVPLPVWTVADAKFWTGTKYYQPWKDVAALFNQARSTSSISASSPVSSVGSFASQPIS